MICAVKYEGDNECVYLKSHTSFCIGIINAIPSTDNLMYFLKE